MGDLASDVRNGALMTEMHPLLLRVCRSVATPEGEALAMVASAWRQAFASGASDDDALRHQVLRHAVAAAASVERARPPSSGATSSTPFFPTGRWRGGWASAPIDVSAVRHDPALAAAAASAAEHALDALRLRLRLLSVLREVEHWPAERVRTLTGLDPRQQAELLREARERVAQALEPLVAEEADE
jgi:DNA-directed RNA polymerase specialized sigma24 family protein